MCVYIYMLTSCFQSILLSRTFLIFAQESDTEITKKKKPARVFDSEEEREHEEVKDKEEEGSGSD